MSDNPNLPDQPEAWNDMLERNPWLARLDVSQSAEERISALEKRVESLVSALEGLMGYG